MDVYKLHLFHNRTEEGTAIMLKEEKNHICIIFYFCHNTFLRNTHER